MKKNDVNKMMDLVDEKYIDEANPDNFKKKDKGYKDMAVKVAVAAVALVVVGSAAWYVNDNIILGNKDNDKQINTSLENTADNNTQAGDKNEENKKQQEAELKYADSYEDIIYEDRNPRGQITSFSDVSNVYSYREEKLDNIPFDVDGFTGETQVFTNEAGKEIECLWMFEKEDEQDDEIIQNAIYVFTNYEGALVPAFEVDGELKTNCGVLYNNVEIYAGKADGADFTGMASSIPFLVSPFVEMEVDDEENLYEALFIKDDVAYWVLTRNIDVDNVGKILDGITSNGLKPDDNYEQLADKIHTGSKAQLNVSAKEIIDNKTLDVTPIEANKISYLPLNSTALITSRDMQDDDNEEVISNDYVALYIDVDGSELVGWAQDEMLERADTEFINLMYSYSSVAGESKKEVLLSYVNEKNIDDFRVVYADESERLGIYDFSVKVSEDSNTVINIGARTSEETILKCVEMLKKSNGVE